MSKRIDWIDIAKGLLIMLVILGHSQIANELSYAINSFHMAAFFVLSGVTFRKNESLQNFILKKVKAILLPYLCFSGIMLIYLFAKTVLFSGYEFDLLSGIISIFVPISGRENTSVYGLWFLPCLFLSEVIINMIMIGNRNIIVVSVTAVIFVMANNFFEITSILSVLPISILFMFFGVFLKDRIQIIKKYSLLCVFISIIMYALSTRLNYQFGSNTVDLSSMNLGNTGLYLLSCIFGTLLIISLSILLKKQKIIQWLGRNSIYYYGLHYEIIGVVEKVIPYWGGVQAVLVIVLLTPLIAVFKYYRDRW